jgi:hypothetical protein
MEFLVQRFGVGQYVGSIVTCLSNNSYFFRWNLTIAEIIHSLLGLTLWSPVLQCVKCIKNSVFSVNERELKVILNNPIILWWSPWTTLSEVTEISSLWRAITLRSDCRSCVSAERTVCRIACKTKYTKLSKSLENKCMSVCQYCLRAESASNGFSVPGKWDVAQTVEPVWLYWYARTQ